MELRERWPLWSFVAIAGIVYTAVVVLSRTLSSTEPGPGPVAIGLILDLTVTVPLAGHLLLVRKGRWPRVTALELMLAGLAAAAVLLPFQRARLLRLLELAVLPVEAALLVWIGARTVRALRRTRSTSAARDAFEQIRRTTRDIVAAPRLADAIAFEVAVFYYALFSWRTRPHGPSRAPVQARAFAYHARSGYGGIVVAVLLLTVVEGTAVHLLVSLWSPVAAWVLTGTSIYAMLWFIADHRASLLRPLWVTSESLWVNTGIRWSVHVERRQIAGMHHERPAGARPFLRATLLGTPTLWVELSEPVVARGPYGFERRVRWIGLSPDDRREFESALSTRPTKAVKAVQRNRP